MIRCLLILAFCFGIACPSFAVEDASEIAESPVLLQPKEVSPISSAEDSSLDAFPKNGGNFPWEWQFFLLAGSIVILILAFFSGGRKK